MNEMIVTFIISVLSIPEEFSEEFEFVSECCYETTFSPVTKSDFMSDCEIALLNYCDVYHNDNKLYYFIMNNISDYVCEEL